MSKLISGVLGGVKGKIESVTGYRRLGKNILASNGRNSDSFVNSTLQSNTEKMKRLSQVYEFLQQNGSTTYFNQFNKKYLKRQEWFKNVFNKTNTESVVQQLTYNALNDRANFINIGHFTLTWFPAFGNFHLNRALPPYGFGQIMTSSPLVMDFTLGLMFEGSVFTGTFFNTKVLNYRSFPTPGFYGFVIPYVRTPGTFDCIPTAIIPIIRP